jgi:SNF2 family DNA or RNA helicase
MMRDDLRMEDEFGDVVVVKDLAALMKLQQITSGFVNPPGGGTPIYIGEKNPRLAALTDLLEDVTGQVIVWARFREELAAVAAALRKAGLRVAEYHGGVNSADRELAVDGFQRGEIDVFVGQPQSGGIGLTLTNAETVIYYSNDFSLETRLQSEDRAHRIGTKRNVVYVDLVATGTIDESIARALQRKSGLAANVLGDFRPSN